MGDGNHQVDENMTNYADYMCSTDGVNMNTHNQACIAKLEFGEPSSSYNGNNYIEMKYHAFNLSRLELKDDKQVVTQENSFWTANNAKIVAKWSGFGIGVSAFVLWSLRKKNEWVEESIWNDEK